MGKSRIGIILKGNDKMLVILSFKNVKRIHRIKTIVAMVVMVIFRQGEIISEKGFKC